jgi:hypothetical protein
MGADKKFEFSRTRPKTILYALNRVLRVCTAKHRRSDM